MLTEFPITALEDTPEQVEKIRSRPIGLVLQQEGLVNDLSYHVNQHRRTMNYDVSDRIVLKLAVSPEVWWAIHFNKANFMRKTLTDEIVFLPVIEESLNMAEVELGDKEMNFKVYVASEVAITLRDADSPSLKETLRQDERVIKSIVGEFGYTLKEDLSFDEAEKKAFGWASPIIADSLIAGKDAEGTLNVLKNSKPTLGNVAILYLWLALNS